MSFIPVSQPLFVGNERQYLQECIDSGWVSSEGPFVGRFEQAMCALTGRTHGVAVCNGTAALEIALQALDLPAEGEVILPDFTIISCASAIIRAGLVPVPVDADPRTWCLDATRVAAAITPRTKAIMVVHIFGLPVDMDPVLEVARQHDLKVIEDAAQAHGLHYKGKPCGGFGDISTFSFYSNKNVTCGEGGMIMTDLSNLEQRCRNLRNLCFQPEKRFVHESLGYNYRLGNLQAAVGLAQSEQLARTVRRKRAIGAQYQELLADLPGVDLPLPDTEYAENAYWVFGLVLQDGLALDAQEAMGRLHAAGIGTRPFFWPMHEQPVFRRQGMFADCRNPVSSRLARRGFYLPGGPDITASQIEKIAKTVRKVLA